MRICVAALCLSVSLPALAADLDAHSTIDAVTVYPDGASVVRVIRLDLPAGDTAVVVRDFPPGLDPSSLRVEGEAGAKLTIGAIDARAPRATPPADLPELEAKIEALHDERAALQDAIAAAQARRKFAERFAEQPPIGIGEKGEARPLSEWRVAFSTVADEIAAADTIIRDVGHKQRVLDRQIARLEEERNTRPPQKMEVRIDLAAAAVTTATLRVTYHVRQARWVPLYDARLETGGKDRKAALELVRRAEIVQTTGEDWRNVSLAVSTLRTGRGGNLPELNTLFVRYPEPPRPLTAPATMMKRNDLAAESRIAAAPAAMPSPMPAQEQQADAEIGNFQVLFKIPGRVSVGANEGAKNLRIATAAFTPELAARGVPSLDPGAYLQASFKQTDDAPILPGKVSIYRDDVYVGMDRMTAAAKDETVRLGFGLDEKIKVERNVVKRNEGTAGFIVGTAKTDERAFKISVRNGHDFPIRMTVEDQLPVSENEEIAVEMLPQTTPPATTNLRDRRGVVEWAFEAKAGESRDIAFGWRLRWPKDKSVILSSAQR